MNSISCFIIDDEPSVAFISEYILTTSRLKLSGYAISISTAMNVFLEKGTPKVLFINIDGIKEFDWDFYDYIQKQRIMVIVTSTIEDYAFQAFESGSIDYLLKPFPYERFLKTKNKIMRILGSSDQKDWFYLKNEKKGKVVRVEHEEIYYIEAALNCVIIDINTKRYKVYKSMKMIEKELSQHMFIRVHKSYIVNEAKIHSLSMESIILDNKEVIRVGRNYREKLMDRLRLAIYFPLFFCQFLFAEEWAVFLGW